MTGFFDDQFIDFECAKCGHKLKVQVGSLRDSPDVVCLGCGQTIHLDANQFREDLGRADKAIDNLKKRIRKLVGKFQ
jgi:transcription elongation factor Elf1